MSNFREETSLKALVSLWFFDHCIDKTFVFIPFGKRWSGDNKNHLIKCVFSCCLPTQAAETISLTVLRPSITTPLVPPTRYPIPPLGSFFIWIFMVFGVFCDFVHFVFILQPLLAFIFLLQFRRIGLENERCANIMIPTLRSFLRRWCTSHSTKRGKW